MGFLRQFTFSVCVSLITASVFSLLSPKGSMNRFFKVLISAFVFISFVIPFQDFRGVDLDFSKIGITNELRKSQSEAAENLINSEIKNVLNKNGIVGADVSCEVRYLIDTGETEVLDIQVAVSDEYDKDEVSKLLFDSLGVNARVVSVGS